MRWYYSELPLHEEHKLNSHYYYNIKKYLQHPTRKFTTVHRCHTTIFYFALKKFFIEAELRFIFFLGGDAFLFSCKDAVSEALGSLFKLCCKS